jgi:dTDP-4-amino-4,6-dideoxygalactose transaminase
MYKIVGIPINDLKRHHERLAGDLDRAVSRVLSRGWFVLGPELEAFEQEFAAFCGVRHAIGVGNGTDALELALQAVGAGPGSEVVTVANAGMYSSTAILRAGAMPVFVDVVPATLMMDPAALEAALTPRTAAVIVTHLYGAMAAIEELSAVAARCDIPLIEDCAHAPGAERGGRKAGSWGTLSCFSFYPTKNLGATGDGGAVVTSDLGLTRRLKALRQYGWSEKYRSTIAGGRNSRLDELQAAVLRTKLPHLDRWNARRREIAAAYCEALAPAGLGLPAFPCRADYVAHLFVIRSSHRDRIRRALQAGGIGTDIHYPVPDHLQESLRSVPFRRTPLPVTERTAGELLTLPCFPEMTDDEVDEVARRVLASIPARSDPFDC